MAGYSRPKMATFFFLFSLVFLFLEAEANDCSAGCQGGGNPADGFLAGHAYTYSLEGAAKIFLTGADNQETGAKITAQATVFGLGNCASILKVTDVQIFGPDGTKYGKPDDIIKPVRFTMQDGVMSPQICAEDNDSQRSLNIKRAILSLLQTATKHNTEVDIFGVCPTSFSTNGNVVSKTRDLNACVNREADRSDLVTYLYNVDSEIKGTNIMQADLRVEANLNSGVVNSAEATENYLYRPFSAGTAGAKATVVTKLQLRDTKRGSMNAHCIVPKSIIFENPHEVNTDDSNLANIQNALKTATQLLDGHVQPKSASIFTELIRILRVSNKDDIYKAYSQINSGSNYSNKKLAVKVFLDALFRAGTGDSIEVSIKLLKNRQLNPLQTRLVLASLASVRHASLDSVNAVTDLLDFPGLPNEVYLGAGALAGAYCRDHSCHGESQSRNEAIVALSTKFASKLGNCKSNSKSGEDVIVAILKGIKNIRHIENCVVDTLVRCASDSSVEPRVRVAALEAFSGDACIRDLQATAFRILEDKNEDSELRIKAYLALLNCPCPELVETVKRVLESPEPVLQVGSFITSSLKNIRASTNPSNAKLREYFRTFTFKKTYPLDPRKYSQAYEMSYNLDTLGVGSVVETNVIYSQTSFLPRSVNMNLTAEVFGKNINLIELGARQGNLDRILEEYFGPHGVVSTHTPQQLYNRMKDTTTSIYEKIQNRLKQSGLKSKRDVQKQVSAFGNKLKTDIPGYKGNLDMDVFVKIFGSEAVFLSLGDDQPASFESLIDRIFDLVEGGIDGAQKFSHEVNSNILFMDMELAYPTASGLPLKLNLEGASTGKLTFGGDMDIRQFLRDIQNAKIDIEVIPSASVEITGTLSIDADVFATGLKTVTTLQSSTGVHVVAKLVEGGKGFDMKVGLPVEKQELITAVNEVVFFTRQKGCTDVDKELKFDTKGYKQAHDCFDQLSQSIGLTLCTDYVIPWASSEESPKVKVAGEALFPLSGPAKVIVYLEKDDLRSFHLYGMNTETEGKSSWELSLEAQGARKSRKVTTRLDKITQPGLYSLAASFDSPIKVLHASATAIMNDREKSVTVKLVNDEDKIMGRIGVITERQGGRNAYKPILEYSAPGQQSDNFRLDGTIYEKQTQQGLEFTFDGVCLAAGNTRFTLDGNTILTKGGLTWDLKGAQGDNRAKTKGVVSYDPETGSHVIEFGFDNSLNPSIDFKFMQNVVIVMDGEDSQGTITVKFVHGKDPENAINYKAKYSVERGEDYAYTLVEDFSYERMQLGYHSEIELKKGRKSKFVFDGKYTQMSAQLAFDFDDKNEKNTQTYGMVKCVINGNGGEVYGSLDDAGKDKKNYQMYMHLYPGGRYEVSGSIKQHGAEENVNVFLTACVKIPNKEDVNIDSSFVSTKQTLDSHAKITQGSVCYLDYDTKVDLEKFTADVKLILKDVISAKGNFALKTEIKKAIGEFTVELHKANKVLFLTTELLMEDPRFTGEMKLYTDYSNDKNQMYKLTTATIKKDNDVDSKNSFFYDNKQIKLNLKMNTNSESENNGFDKYYVDFYDSVGTVYNLGFNAVTSSNNGLLNQNTEMTIGKKASEGAKPNKLVLKMKLTDYNEGKTTGCAEVDMTFVKESGEDITWNMQTTVNEKPGRSEVEVKTSLTGAMAPSELNYHSWLDYSDNDDDDKNFDINYKLKGNYGVKTSFDGSGKFVQSPGQGNEEVYKNDFDMQINLPVEKMHTLRITTKDVTVFKNEEGNDDGIDVSSLTTLMVNNEKYVYDCGFTMGNPVDKLRIAFDLPNRQPFVLDMYRSVVKNEPENKLNSEVKFLLDAYGDKYTFHSTGYRTYPEDKYNEYQSELTLPKNMKYRSIKKQLKMTTDLPNKSNIDLSVDVDGAVYTLNSNVDINKGATSIIDIKASQPGSQPGRLYIKSMKLSDRNVEGHAIVENFGDFSLDMMVNGELNGADDFKIKVDIDCPKFNAQKLHFEAINEPTGGAHKIQFFATENGNNVLSGVTTYNSKYEGQKFIMEGTGNVRVRDEQKTTSFKYIRDKKISGDELGVEVFFNVALGVKNVVVEFKDTNKAYKFTSVYCEEKKECAHVEVISSSERGDDSMSVNFQVGFDLRKLGFAPEFGLQSKFEKQKGKLPVYNTDMHVTRGEQKYHTEMYGKMVKGTYQTAFISSTPNRVISLETTNSYAESGLPNFPIVHEAIFHMNKNDPRTKTHFKSSLDHQKTEREVNLNGDIYFIYPGAEKEMQVVLRSKYDLHSHSVNTNLNIDIFKKKNQKMLIECKFNPVISSDLVQYDASLHVSGRGLGLECVAEEKFSMTKDSLQMSGKTSLGVERQRREYSYNVDVTSDKQLVKVTLPAGDVLSINNEISTSGDKVPSGINWKLMVILFGDMKYQFDGKVDASNGMVAEWNGGCLVTNEVLVLSATFVPSKQAEVSASYKENGRVHPLIKLGYSVKGGAPASINAYNIENLKAAMQSGGTNLDLISKRATQYTRVDQEPRNKFNNRIATIFKNAIPDFTACRDYFKNELSAISDDLKNDEFLQPFHANIEAFMQIVYTITENFLAAFSRTTQLMAETVEAFNESFNNRILPALTETYDKLVTAAVAVLNSFMDLAMNFVDFIDGIVKKHAADWQPIMKEFEQTLDQALNAFMKWSNEIQESAAAFIASITKEIEELPIIGMIKEKTDALYSPDGIMEIVNFVGGCFANLVPTKEWDNFYSALFKFIERKVRRESGNDYEEIQNIIQKGSLAIDGIFHNAKTHVGANGITPFALVYVPFSPESIGTLPMLKQPKISAANYAQEDLPSFKDLYQSYRLNSFDPEDLIPPYNMRGYIAGGQHVFTFDGRHLTFPGSCKYVVAQDAVDGNFSIILNLQNGQPKSINLVDNSGNSIEVDTDGKLLLNGSPYGFPVVYADTEAWKRGSTFTIKTKYGATVKCSNSLDLCYVKVSGYYYGKLRGLLGDGNNEPFDDFRLPSGKMARSESEFGNAYALTSGCAGVKTPDHSEHSGHGGHAGHAQSGICHELFGEDSDLSYCNLAVDISNYKMACRHAVEAASSPDVAQSEACLIAKTYALACRSNAFPVPVPDMCVRCEVNGEKLNAGDEMDVASPNNQADIILTVETTRSNEKTYRDLVVPMMSSLVDELKKKKMTDIKVYLVGIKPDFLYPIFYDVNDPKLGGCKISFTDQDRSTPWESPVRTDNEVFDDYVNTTGQYLDYITTQLGVDAMSAALFGLEELELRPKAAKTIIMVHSEACPSGLFTTFASAAAEEMMKKIGTTAHLISPMHCVAPGVKNSHNIVGFNDRDVFVVGDKKRGHSHSNLRDGITYPDDECAAFALKTFGNVYSSTNFHSLGPNPRKSFLLLTSQTIADSMSMVTYESECKCEVGLMEIIPKVRCSTKSRKEPAAPKKSGKKK